MTADVPDKSAGAIRETLPRVKSCLARGGNVPEPPGLACNELCLGGKWHHTTDMPTVLIRVQSTQMACREHIDVLNAGVSHAHAPASSSPDILHRVLLLEMHRHLAASLSIASECSRLHK